jgi:tRNA nucleotidyltransferase/poly(A) polymerase
MTQTLYSESLSRACNSNAAFVLIASAIKRNAYTRCRKTVSMPRLPLPDFFAKNVPDGPNAYLVGGAVRDLLMQRHPTDLDVAVDGDAAVFAAALAQRLKARVVPMGKPGQITYRVTSPGFLTDITGLAGISLANDLKRRDFTVNAMAYDLHAHRLIDLLGGQEDIEAGRIRMVTEQAFVDDPLRLLRAFRMAAVLDFTIDRDTFRAITRHAHRISQPAGERLRAELVQLMACPDSARQIETMSNSGLLTSLFPEMAPMQGCRQNRHHDFDVYDHTLNAYAAVEQCLQDAGQLAGPLGKRYHEPPYRRTTAAILKYAVLLHDIGKPETRQVDADGQVHFHGHTHRSEQMAEAIHARLRLSKTENEQARTIIANHGRPLDLLSARRAGNLSLKGINRLFRNCDPWAPEVLLHALGDTLGKRKAPDAAVETALAFIKDLIRDYYDRYRPLADRQPLIGGRDLMNRFGLKPSALLGDILKAVEDERFAGRIGTRDEALAHAARVLAAMDRPKQS